MGKHIRKELLSKMSDFNYESIDITNDFMFGYVMSDPERCKLFLEQI